MKQLSEKQKQLLQLLSDGLTQKEIAGTMETPIRTIEWELSRLRKYLNCSNNEQLTKVALKGEFIK